MTDIAWIVIEKYKQIGAIGFIDNQAAVVVAFYDDYDGNQDGKVGWLEWGVGKLSLVNVKNSAVTEVAMAARYDQRVLRKDPKFQQEAAAMFLDFAQGLVADGLYSSYFSSRVSALIKPIAGRITSNVVAQYVIAKHMHKQVRKVYDYAMKS